MWRPRKDLPQSSDCVAQMPTSSHTKIRRQVLSGGACLSVTRYRVFVPTQSAGLASHFRVGSARTTEQRGLRPYFHGSAFRFPAGVGEMRSGSSFSRARQVKICERSSCRRTRAVAHAMPTSAVFPGTSPH